MNGGIDPLVEEIKSNSSNSSDDVITGRATYFTDNVDDRDRVVNKFLNMNANQIADLYKSDDAILIYLSALNAKYVSQPRNSPESVKIYIKFKNLYNAINIPKNKNLINRINDIVAPALSHQIKEIKSRHNGGYDDRDYYNRGGYDDRDYYSRGGMDRGDDDYEGGYRNRYYSDNMHGGALGEFRNEIGRNLFNNNVNKLRENILNIELD
jgi:hypothetical protein